MAISERELHTELMEPVYVPETIVTGFMAEDCGGFWRFVLYTDRRSSMDEGTTERIIVARHIIPKPDMAKMKQNLDRLLSAH